MVNPFLPTIPPNSTVTSRASWQAVGAFNPVPVAPPRLANLETFQPRMLPVPDTAHVQPRNLSGYYMNLGERHYQANRFQEAIAAFSAALEQDSQNYIAWNKRGVAKASVKDYAGAIADYTRALAIKPDFYNAYINRGNLKVYVRDYNAALDDYGRAIRLNPMNAVAYENRSEVYATLGMRELSLRDKAMVIQLQKMKGPIPGLPFCPPRIALILGNDDYAGTKNDLTSGPVQDVMSMRGVLQNQGFEVITGLNLTGPQMKERLAYFTTRLKQNPGAVSLVYYSGHGGSINGNNYLIPVDYTGTIDAKFVQEAVSVDYILQQLKTADSFFNIMILDACRNALVEERGFKAGANINNPDVLRQWESEPSPGLSNVWIEYASRPRMPALQYDNRGLYTKYLLQYMIRPDLNLKEVSMLASYALEKDPIAARGDQHARTQTDLSRTEAIAEAFSFARHC